MTKRWLRRSSLSFRARGVPNVLSLENWSPKKLVLGTKFFMENWSMDQNFHGKLVHGPIFSWKTGPSLKILVPPILHGILVFRTTKPCKATTQSLSEHCDISHLWKAIIIYTLALHNKRLDIILNTNKGVVIGRSSTLQAQKSKSSTLPTVPGCLFPQSFRNTHTGLVVPFPASDTYYHFAWLRKSAQAMHRDYLLLLNGVDLSATTNQSWKRSHSPSFQTRGQMAS